MWWVVNTMLRPVYSQESPSIQCVGGWAGPRAGLKRCGKFHPHRDSIPVPSSKQRVAIQTEISRSTVLNSLMYICEVGCYKYLYRSADKSLAWPGRNKLMFLSEWREFPSAPCLAGKKNLMTARVSMLKSRASSTCFRACYFPGRAKAYQDPGYNHIPLHFRTSIHVQWPLGRPRRRWVDNVRMDQQEVGCGYRDWIGLAQDRDRWRTIVSAVMNLRVPWNAGNFLTSCKSVSFSRWTLQHGVNK